MFCGWKWCQEEYGCLAPQGEPTNTKSSVTKAIGQCCRKEANNIALFVFGDQRPRDRARIGTCSNVFLAHAFWTGHWEEDMREAWRQLVWEATPLTNLEDQQEPFSLK